LDGKVAVMDEIACALRSASPEEVAAMQEVLDELIVEEREGSAHADRITFYKEFLQGFGLTS